MPRQARLDAFRTSSGIFDRLLHHVMVRGLDRQSIFRDEVDRADFVARLAGLAETGALTVFAWALLPNHLHLLVRTGTRPLARSMRSLLTGYAGAVNRRHKRAGHLFQNRYKSIVVEEEPYLLELVRYLHLNPLRARVLPDLRALERDPWTGHSALVGTGPRPWQATAEILAQFGPPVPCAKRAYRAFVAAGLPRGRRPELQGGGLRRSLGGWAAVAALRRGREAYVSDERVLGSSDFVEHLRQEVPQPAPARAPRSSLPDLVARVCRLARIPPEALTRGSRRAAVARAREGMAYLAVDVCGHSGASLLSLLGVGAPSLCNAAQRGRADQKRWDSVLHSEQKNIRKEKKQRPGIKVHQEYSKKVPKDWWDMVMNAAAL
jgi:putative transposase